MNYTLEKRNNLTFHPFPLNKPPIAPPTPIKTILTINETIMIVIPVVIPVAKPASPPKIVPPITSNMARTIDPNAPATVAFHNPPIIPSWTQYPTINPVMNNPRLTPQYSLTYIPNKLPRTKAKINPTTTGPHFTIVIPPLFLITIIGN